MAERRMFAKTIIDSDAFLDMPLSAQSLYFHLSMRADDDGFINNPKKIQRMIGASDDDCRLLLQKRFLITFESGVVVIKHWKIHNYIQKDRYKPTLYQTEKALLIEKENKAYTEKKDSIQDVYRVDTDGIPNGYQPDTQVRLGKESIELSKDSVVVEEGESPCASAQDNPSDPNDQLTIFKGNILLSENQMGHLLDLMGLEVFDEYIAKLQAFIEAKGANIKSHYQTLLKWYNEDRKVKCS